LKRQTAVVRCEHGLHARVAAQVVRAARDFDATVTLRCRDCPEANACSILQLLMLGAEQGADVEIEADGADEDAALRAVAGVFEQGGGI
jgi:phosphotransferase system HPr (HPr) family protein